MIRIANAQFWVHDQEDALAFYTGRLGWQVRADVTMPEWNFRWLVVGPAGQPDVGLVLTMALRYFPFVHFAVSQALETSGGEFELAARLFGALPAPMRDAAGDVPAAVAAHADADALLVNLRQRALAPEARATR